MKRASPILILLILLAGCSFFQTLEIYPAHVTGAINEEFTGDVLTTGYTATWSVSGSSGPITVDYGDGTTDEIAGDVAILIEHTYTKAGYYEVEFLRGRARGVASVTVRPIGFELFLPFWTQGEMVGIWEEILFDPFPRLINCNNSDSYNTGLLVDNESVYLIPGPFGDMYDSDKLSSAFDMRVYATTTDGEIGSVYGKNGDVITGVWVPLQTYRVIADWPWAKPPYPLLVLPKDCSYPVDDDDPWIPPAIPDGTGAFLVRQDVRRVSGGPSQGIQFEIYVGGAACP